MKTLTLFLVLAVCILGCRAQNDALVEVVLTEEPPAPASAFALFAGLASGERDGSAFAPGHVFSSDVDPNARSYSEFTGFLREHGATFTLSEGAPTIVYGSPSSNEVLVHVNVQLSVAATGQTWKGEYVHFIRSVEGLVVEYRSWSSDAFGLADAFRPRTPAAALRALSHYWNNGFWSAYTKLQRPDALTHFHGAGDIWPGLTGTLSLGTLEGVQKLNALFGGDTFSNIQLQVISEHEHEVFGHISVDRKNSVTKAKDHLGSHYVVLHTDEEGKATSMHLYVDTTAIPEDSEAKNARKHEADVRRKEEKAQSKLQKKQEKEANKHKQAAQAVEAVAVTAE